MRGLAALTLVAVLVWVGFIAEQGWGLSSLVVLVALLVGVWLVAVARHMAPKGPLRWDGEQWYWTDVQERAVCAMACILDLQVVMLLQVTCDQGKSHWIWLESGHKPAKWKALRRAIVAGTGNLHDGVVPEPIDS